MRPPAHPLASHRASEPATLAKVGRSPEVAKTPGRAAT